jgi:hypothetical protein
MWSRGTLQLSCANTGHVRVDCTTCRRIVFECPCQDVEKALMFVVCPGCIQRAIAATAAAPPPKRTVERRWHVSDRRHRRRRKRLDATYANNARA